MTREEIIEQVNNLLSEEFEIEQTEFNVFRSKVKIISKVVVV